MELTEEETYKVERWLKRKHVNVEEVAGFTFMQYYKPRPSKCKPYWCCLYGLGVFIFTLKSGFVRGAQLQGMWLNMGLRLNPAWIVQYLLVRKIPFTNYETPLKQLDRLSSIRTYDEFQRKCVRVAGGEFLSYCLDCFFLLVMLDDFCNSSCMAGGTFSVIDRNSACRTFIIYTLSGYLLPVCTDAGTARNGLAAAG